MTIRRWILAVAVAAVGIVSLNFVNGGALWVGHADIPLEFFILDSSTGQPLKGAVLRFVATDVPSDETEPIVCEAITGADGRARLVHTFMTSGYSSALRNTRTVNYNLALVIKAADHEEHRAYLWDITREPGFHSDSVPPLTVIRLPRRSSRQDGSE
jgi:hypothetical protein